MIVGNHGRGQGGRYRRLPLVLVGPTANLHVDTGCSLPDGSSDWGYQELRDGLVAIRPRMESAATRGSHESTRFEPVVD